MFIPRNLPIILELFFMLSYSNYSKNYSSIIDWSLATARRLKFLLIFEQYYIMFIFQGRIQDSEKGGAQLCYCEHGNCVRSTQSGMQSMPNLGGSGGIPPQKILKIKPSEIKSEGIFNGLFTLLSLLLQDSILHNN